MTQLGNFLSSSFPYCQTNSCLFKYVLEMTLKVQLKDNYVFLKAILFTRIRTIDAFVESIFSSALDAEDEFMIRICLQSGTDPNLLIEDRRERPPCIPLQFETARGNVALVKTLLEFEADLVIILFDFWAPPSSSINRPHFRLQVVWEI